MKDALLHRLGADKILRVIKTGRPACLNCGKALKPSTSYTRRMPTEAEAVALVPEGCKLIRTRQSSGSVAGGWEATYYTTEHAWGEVIGGGYFCTQKCGVAFGVRHAEKLGFMPAVGGPDKLIKKGGG